MRIAIFGTGGAGGYFGGRLAQAGEEVVFIARGEHLRAIRERGLRVDSIKGDFVIQPAQATDDPAQAGVRDAIIVGVKTWQLPEAALAMRPMVGPETAVIPLLNGVEAAAELGAALGAEHVLGGLAQIISLIAGPGHIRHAGADPYIAFGEMDRSVSERVERLRQVFARCEGVTVEVPSDIQVALWRKFMFITAISGVGAVTRAPAGAMRSVPGTRALLEGAMREVVAVAHARGIALPDDAPEKAMAFIDNLPPGATASMQRDIMEGRRSELDAQNGAVARLGKEAGLPTPIHAFIYHSLLPMELKARGEVQFG
jgi:2-dehydropantoate 2-reductase